MSAFHSESFITDDDELHRQLTELSQATFRDRDSLSQRELAEALRALGLALTLDQVKETLRSYDTDRNEQIDVAEFHKIVRDVKRGEEVRVWVRNETPLESKLWGDGGITSLMIAAKFGALPAVEELIALPVDVDATTTSLGVTALQARDLPPSPTAFPLCACI